MQSSNRKLFDSLVSRTKIYLVIIFILLVAICTQNPKFIIPAIILFIAILGYTYFANNKRKSEISQHLQDLTLNVNSAAKNSLIYSPIPLIIVETDGNIVWRSTKFVSEFANIDINGYISDLLDNINTEINAREDKKDKSIIRSLKIENKTYKILGEFVKSGNHERKRENKYTNLSLSDFTTIPSVSLVQSYIAFSISAIIPGLMSISIDCMVSS